MVNVVYGSAVFISTLVSAMFVVLMTAVVSTQARQTKNSYLGAAGIIVTLVIGTWLFIIVITTGMEMLS